jgi:predicted transcriptional regulator
LIKGNIILLKEIELKQRLIAKINDTHNLELMEQLSEIIDFESDEIYILSPEEKAAVKEGIGQIDNGSFFTNEEARKIIDKCLGK